jgi:pyruvate kinase
VSDASHRRTKLVCTIGPASVPHIRELVAAGMDVARINFSHGTPDEHKEAVHAVRGAAHAARRSVAVMIDLPGAKIRLGEFTDGQVELVEGLPFELRPSSGVDSEAAGSSSSTTVDRATLADELRPGDPILLADGVVELRVAGSDGGTLQTEVVHGGVVRSRSGVTIPAERRAADGLSGADREAVPRALELRVDLIAQSFVTGADDVRQLRQLLPADGPRLVAKIETQAAVDNFAAIGEAADGVMIARGDLGLAIPYAHLPLLQKDLLTRAATAGLFSIVATQMLESMVSAARPTRAEASDVANAVLDGADALMLSAETAIGRYPVEALSAMCDICEAAETRGAQANGPGERQERERTTDVAEAIVHASAALAPYAGTDAIWCFTRSGRTAELLSMARPPVPILAFTPSPIVARRLAVRRGVVPLVMPAGGNGTLLERMRATSKAQHGLDGQARVALVTTSAAAGGINRLEIVDLA